MTPAFPGFISGHSTFSRAAAEVLAALHRHRRISRAASASSSRPPDAFLVFEHGPSAEVRLQWATYYDAADQAGQSRIWGGIHMQPDDFAGRIAGSAVGTDAVATRATYFDGTARP